MDRGVPQTAAPWVLGAFGVLLSGFAAVWHLGVEMRRLGAVGGPLVAFVLDGIAPLTLVYVAYRLRRTGQGDEFVWSVFRWCVAGGFLFGVVVLLSIALRYVEGRTVAEPAFVLLLAVNAGSVAGAIAGYYATKARRDADRAARARHTLSFVNGLLRHDIRNSLTIIDGRASMIADDGDGESPRAAAGAIREQVDEISAVVDNAGAVADTVSPGQSTERVDLTDVAEDVVDRMQGTYDATVRLAAPEDAPVRANEAIRPVVKNLVENAVEHNEDPTVDVRVVVDDGTVRLHVVDDGDGIEADRADAVFDARAGDTHGGGLHLVETLVEQFGGDIWVADGGPGAHFVVELRRV